MAIVCTIIPPIDAPTMCAAGISSASRSPTASAASSESVYGASIGCPAAKAAYIANTSGGGPSVFVDSPVSRLSKRITRKPRSSSSDTNPGDHSVIWAPRPITRSNGGASGSPKLS